MKINILHITIILILVLILFSFKPSDLSLELNDTNIITINLGLIRTKYNFVNIFFTNLIVGLFLSVAGFFTGGILTLIVIVWNALLFWLIYSIATYHHNQVCAILYLLKHSPLEIYALALFSIIGFRGFKFYKNLIISQKFDRETFPNVKEMILPTILLLFASLIEVF